MKDTKIGWCDHTFNPWIGCSPVSAGCDNCYAAALAHRFSCRTPGAYWNTTTKKDGRLVFNGQINRTSVAYWHQPKVWNFKAGLKMAGWEGFRDVIGTDDAGLIAGGHVKPQRPRVFCASLSDWLHPSVPSVWLADLLQLIRDTPNLDWLLLTKRPEKFRDHLAWAAIAKAEILPICSDWLAGNAPRNVWIGATIENQAMANKRIPDLLKIPARVRFLSCEPLLEGICLHWACKPDRETSDISNRDVLDMVHREIHWIICGGESGPGARLMRPDWARDLRNFAKNSAGVPFFFKQWGEWLPHPLQDWTKEQRSSGEGYDMFRHGWLARKYEPEAETNLDGKQWREFPIIGK